MRSGISMLGLNPDRATLLFLRLRYFWQASKWSDSKIIPRTKNGLSDGIIKTLYYAAQIKNIYPWYFLLYLKFSLDDSFRIAVSSIPFWSILGDHHMSGKFQKHRVVPAC